MAESKPKFNPRKLIKPILLTLLIGIVFFLLFFPTGDLGDLVSSKVSELTDNQVFISFSNFSFNVTPPGVEFQEVFLETAFTPGLSAEEISISPSIGGIISKKPFGSFHAKGLLNGDVSITLKKGQTTETGTERQRVILEVEQISLASLRETMKWNLALEGALSLNADGQGDLALNEQPDVDLTIDLEKFNLPPATINTMMGPLTLPDLKLTHVNLKGRLSAGKFIIENGTVGDKKDDLHGKLKGFWNIQLIMLGGRPVPQLGAYDFEIDLTAGKAFQAKAGLFLSLLDQFKANTADGARYNFKASAPDLNSPPSFAPAH